MHRQKQSKTDTPENIFKEKEPDSFCWAWHKELCNDIIGDLMFCQDCKQTISTTDIVNQSLKRWKDYAIPGIRAQDNRPDTNIQLSPERLDMAAYNYLYHMNEGCILESDPFWGNKTFSKHCWSIGLKNIQLVIVHNKSKKAASVGFYFHFMSTPCRIEVTTTRTGLCGFVWTNN